MSEASNEMRVELAHIAEADDLTDICVHATREYGYDEETLQRFRPALVPNLALIAAGLTFVARDVGGKARGVMALRPTQFGGLSLLDRILVEPGEQRAGVGRALFERAICQAQAMQSAAILIYSHPRAEGFYSHLGAKRVGETPFYLSPELLMPMMVYSIPSQVPAR